MLKKGDLILLYKDPHRKYLVKISNGRFHTDRGFLDFDQILAKNFGDRIETNLGDKFSILRPCLYDLIMKVHRNTQIIYPKDIGIILVYSHIFPGARVIECGSGSGALTTALANFVRPTGKVYSYEQRNEFLENAKKNIERNGLSEWVEFKNCAITDSFQEENVDFIMIDIGSPWELIDAAYASLKNGARIASICPTFDQLTQTVFAMEEKGFTNIESMEVLLRRILVRRGKTRPEQRMPSHTGWLVFGNKTLL